MAIRRERGDPLVLVVEDNDEERTACASYLRSCGFRVAEAADGPLALVAASELHPDVIVMDRGLPTLDGFEVTRRLRRQRETRDVPIVALTASTEAAHVRAAWLAGCDAFLGKPCAPATLEQVVRRLAGATPPH